MTIGRGLGKGRVGGVSEKVVDVYQLGRSGFFEGGWCFVGGGGRRGMKRG